jgi:hypothetical protein
MVQAVSSQAGNPSFGKSVLPWRSKSRAYLFESKPIDPIEAEDKEHVENAKRRRGYDSEINRKGLVQMIAKERCPSLSGARWRRDVGHIA